MTTFKIRLLYILYTVTAVIFFLYYLFPADALTDYIAGRVHQTWPQYRLRIDTLRPAMAVPPGIKLTGVQVLKDNKDWLKAPQVSVVPKLVSLIRGEPVLRYSGRAYDGNFSGNLVFGKTDRQRPENATLRLTGIQIREEMLSGLSDLPELDGIIDGHVTYARNRKTGESLDANVTFSSVSLVIPSLSATIGTLGFTKIQTDVTLERQSLNFRRSEFTGPQMDGTLAGSIRLNAPLGKSRLNLRVTVTPNPEYLASLKESLPVMLLPKRGAGNSGYSFRIFGTLEKPSFSITR